MNLDKIRSYVESDLVLVNQIITEQLESHIPLIQVINHHIFEGRGKQIRPILVLLGAQAFNYSGQHHLILAAIVELIHTATLLHDDVVDDSSLRRGRETANKIWGNEASVLVGDYLYSRSFQLVSQVNSMQIMAILADAANKITSGEVLQLLKRNDLTLTELQYMEIIDCKTATLFAAAAQLGAVLSQQSSQNIDSMMAYGHHIGLAFQLIDDALDYGASENDFGKKVGKDLAEGKLTLPLIYALQHGSESEIKFMRSAIHHPELSKEDLHNVCSIIESTRAIQYTHQLAEKQIDQALSCLPDLPNQKCHQALTEIAKFASVRGY